MVKKNKTLKNRKTYFEKYKLDLRNIKKEGIAKYGSAKVVNGSNYLASFSLYSVEIYDNSMRTIHCHECDELGFVQEGVIQVFLWKNEKDYTMTTVTKGNLWCIPRGTLHSLNNVGENNAVLRVSFNSKTPSDNDISVLLNGLPQYIKNEYCESPHSLLKNFIGPNTSYLFAPYPKSEVTFKTDQKSDHLYKLENSKPDFYDKYLGKIVSVDKNKWPTLKDKNFSFSNIYLQPNVSTQAFWYLNNDTIYVIYEGNAEIYMTIPGQNNNNNKVSLQKENYYFVPSATQHVIRNSSSTSILKIAAFYSNDTFEYYSLNQGLLFFGEPIIQSNLITNKMKPLGRSKYKTFKKITQRLFKIS
jgi:oxalate decarboxylase/phosphoglucose isomerase-like protein (cupin superfamily)